MLTLFDAVSGDPLELCVKIAAYYGLRRSEVLGLNGMPSTLRRKPSPSATRSSKRKWMASLSRSERMSSRPNPAFARYRSFRLSKSFCWKKRRNRRCSAVSSKILLQRLPRLHLRRPVRQTPASQLCDRTFRVAYRKVRPEKIRFHDLRHTCASLLLSSGISMKQIQIWLGHSTFATTADIYAHLDFTAQEESAHAMSGMFSREPKEVQPA